MAEMKGVGQNPPRRVALWIPGGGQLIGMIGVLEAFDIANRIRTHLGKLAPYRTELVGAGEEAECAAGITVKTRPVHGVRGVDTLIVGGSLRDLEIDTEQSATALHHLARLARTADRVVSICAGAFWLGQIGLLDGRRCTTHWLAVEQLAERYPQAHVELDTLFTEDGKLFTSAGATAGIDLALHLIRKDGGPRLALSVARSLVVFAQRTGGQSQFSATVRLPASVEDRIRSVLEKVVAQPNNDHSVEAMARTAGMSSRHFARVFRDQTGKTPAAFVVHARVEAAQRFLVESDRGLDWIASRAGFGSVESLRRNLVRVGGVGPSEYRRRFQAR